MHRIDNSSAAETKPASTWTSTPGYFTPGDPTSETGATILDYFWANTVQEEIAGVIEQGASMMLDPSNDNQLLAALRAMLAAIPHGVQVFSAPGSATFTVPAGVVVLDVELWGGGSGSFASHGTTPSGGGAAGGYSRKRISGLTPGQAVVVTVGAGGNAGLAAGPTWPTPGGTTSFGSFASATGASLNTLTNPTSQVDFGGGPGGIGVGGDLNIQGSSGGFAATGLVSNNQGGPGAASAIGGSVGSGAGAGVAGIAPGGGAAGAGIGVNASTSQDGAPGAAGLCIVRW